MSIRTGILGLAAALSLSTAISLPGFAEESIDLLRTVPLEIKDYASAQSFPEKFTTAEQIIQALNSTPVLLVHMEALRRGYHDLLPAEQEKLLTQLHARRQTNTNDLMLGFDHGYAQLVYKNNKTGLFFLRKANDKFQDQFSNLAYGMAQAEADITLENSTPEEMTTRKMDVTYRLGDAVKIDAEKHQPGFWPSYIKVIEKLKPLPAYRSFTRRDFSLAYLPQGNSVVPLKGPTTSELPLTEQPQSLLSNSVNTTCNPAESPASSSATEAFENITAQRTATFNGYNTTIQFAPTEQTKLYKVRVLGPTGTPLLSFKTYTMPNDILEDLDGDGVLEIVARQYQNAPFQPVLVYRYTPCGFELDREVVSNFH